MWQLKTSARGSGLDAVKGAVYVRKDVSLVLDADRYPQEAVGDPEALAFLGWKAAMRRDGRVQHFGEKIADRRRGSCQLERIEESEGRRPGVVAKGKGDHASVEAAELACR